MEKKLTERGGTPSPLNGRLLPKTERKKINEKNPKILFGVFQPKNTVFGPKS